MKKLISTFLCAFFLFGTFLFTSCNDTEDVVSSIDEEAVLSEDDSVINSFGLDDFNKMRAQLQSKGIDIPAIDPDNDLESASTRGLILENPLVKAIKVKTKSLHPNKSGRYIDLSGVLLVPKKNILNRLKTFRIAIVPPPTYTHNNSAPSIAFERMSVISDDLMLNYLYFWTLQAELGFVVFIPDYPGYGDSRGQCFHPYLDAKALVNSTLDLFKAAQKTLTANGYKYKKEVVISGYSQGGFVSASLAREIETNPAHGLSVSLLFTGGTPCNLKYIVDAVRRSSFVQHTYFLPYGMWGYKENAYPNINVSEFLKEPYASVSKSYYDGTHFDLLINEYYPHIPAKVYTEKFMKHLDSDPSISYMNKILDENSVKPWKNKCDFVMTHGSGDVSVYYQNAKNFADEQNKAGGKVSFYSTVGDHVAGYIPYFTRASAHLIFYK